MNRLSRRELLGALVAAGASLVGTGCARRGQAIEGGIIGGPAKAGHLLRDGGFPPVTHEERTGVVIVGGGVSGLSAGWELLRRSAGDFTLLELNDACGGNAISGDGPVTPFPWGAHYIPVASAESILVRELFRELGVITSPDGSSPVYREEYLCADPQERLYRRGRWSSGVLPSEPLSSIERDELARFHDFMHEQESLVGSDGRKAFSIPMELGSFDTRFTKLDQVSFSEYLDELGLMSEPLRWYVDYCCRDDYGARAADTSAWAGIHYFAARRGWAANAAPSDVVTWPEGNGWVVKKLAERIGDRIRSDSLVYRVSSEGAPFVEYFDLREHRSVRIRAESVIIATPRFVATRLLGEADAAGKATPISYRPWIVANLHLTEPPDAGVAWDNVIYGSRSLGYVSATHQQHRTRPARTVLTYYLPLSDLGPMEARRTAYETPWEVWRDRILEDLSVPHPAIRSLVERIDVWRWGHGMVSPGPGFISGEGRRRLADPIGRIRFAHSDMSGLSLFEEAQYRGVTAARDVLGVRA